MNFKGPKLTKYCEFWEPKFDKSCDELKEPEIKKEMWPLGSKLLLEQKIENSGAEN